MRHLIVLIFLVLASPARAEGTRVAFFGFHLLGSPTDQEFARGQMMEERVRDRFAEEGFVLVDLSPVAGDLERVVNPANCYGCDLRMAAKLDADYVLVGEVQKVSEALLAIHLQLRDAKSGDIVRVGVVDIRGNSDETWSRGVRYLLNNRIFREELK